MSEYKGVMVLCEVAEGKLAGISTELLGAGSKLAADLGQELYAVVIGSGVAGLAQEVIAYGAAKVYVVDDPVLKDYLTDSYLSAMEKVIKQVSPSIVLLGQTQIGRDLAPRLAHAVLPIPGKGSSDWRYAWIPVVGPVAGGILGAVLYNSLVAGLTPLAGP